MIEDLIVYVLGPRLTNLLAVTVIVISVVTLFFKVGFGIWWWRG